VQGTQADRSFSSSAWATTPSDQREQFKFLTPRSMRPWIMSRMCMWNKDVSNSTPSQAASCCTSTLSNFHQADLLRSTAPHHRQVVTRLYFNLRCISHNSSSLTAPRTLRAAPQGTPSCCRKLLQPHDAIASDRLRQHRPGHRPPEYAPRRQHKVTHTSPVVIIDDNHLHQQTSPRRRRRRTSWSTSTPTKSSSSPTSDATQLQAENPDLIPDRLYQYN
jgi:hypothetical protein